MTQQILTIIAQQLTLILAIAGGIFLIGLIFEKQLTALYEKAEKNYHEKQAEKKKQEYLALQHQKEADRKKVQKIRDNFNRELETTGRICVPYYAVSDKAS